MRLNHVLKVNTLGGIFTPIKMKSVVETAFKYGAQNINFGPRQELFFNIHKENLQDFQNAFDLTDIRYECDSNKYPGIVSSYPAEGIMSPENWLTEGIYKDIFDLIDFESKFKINIIDSEQSLIPFFSGELNFISSYQQNYWHLFINIKGQKNMIQWNKLIYSMDIIKIVREIEELYFNNKISDMDEIMKLVNQNTAYLSNEIQKELQIPRYVFPYYEGLNRYGDKYWLGVYRRDYQFPIPFIYELCNLCEETKIGQICVTPWRTLAVKGIENKDRIKWEKLLGKHGINLRHSSLELNWMIDDINSRELALKKDIIDDFDQKDIRTFGLVFGFKLNSENNIPASVIIEEKPFLNNEKVKILVSYDIHHTENFNPNSIQKTIFAKGVSKRNLSKKLLELCQKYYSQLNENTARIKLEEPVKKAEQSINKLYQCQHCFTVYNEDMGDESTGIKKGTTFSELPESFECSLCGAHKSDYFEIQSQKLVYS